MHGRIRETYSIIRKLFILDFLKFFNTMPLPELFVTIIVYLVVTIVYVVVNAILLREIVLLFNVEDDTVATATAISVWMGGILLFLSFLSDIKIIGWLIAVVINIFFIFLIKRYYYQSWKQSLLIWETWMATFIYLALFIFAFSTSTFSLIFWGLIPLGINITFILFMKFYRNSLITHIATNVVAFILINAAWISIFKVYFPI